MSRQLGTTIGLLTIYACIPLPSNAHAQVVTVVAIEQNVSVPDGWGGDIAFSGTTMDTGGFWSAADPTQLTVPAGVTHVHVHPNRGGRNAWRPSEADLKAANQRRSTQWYVVSREGLGFYDPLAKAPPAKLRPGLEWGSPCN